MLIKPSHSGFIQRLIPPRIAQDSVPDPAKSPGDQGCEGDAHRDDQDQRDRQRDELRHPPFHPLLQRPNNGDDEQREREWLKNDLRLIGGERDHRCGHDRKRGLRFDK